MLRVAVAPCSPFSVTGEADDRGGRPGPPARRAAAHPPRRDRRRGDVLPRTVRRDPDRVRRLAGLARSDDVWMAHAVHLDDAAVARFGATGTGVAHCPSSNARLGAGIARTRDLRRRRRPGRARGRRRGVQRGRLAARRSCGTRRCSPGPAAGRPRSRCARRCGWRRWAAPGCSAGPTRSARSRSASSPTSRCGGSTRCRTPASPTRSPRWPSARRRRSSCCWSTVAPVVEQDRLVTVDEDELARDAARRPGGCCERSSR